MSSATRTNCNIVSCVQNITLDLISFLNVLIVWKLPLTTGPKWFILAWKPPLTTGPQVVLPSTKVVTSMMSVLQFFPGLNDVSVLELLLVTTYLIYKVTISETTLVVGFFLQCHVLHIYFSILNRQYKSVGGRVGLNSCSWYCLLISSTLDMN